MISRKQLERWDMPLGECVTMPRHGGGYVCGFGGSGNKSSSSSAASTTTNNADNRQVVDGGSIGLSNSSNNVVQLLDGGAVSGAMTAATNAIAAMGIISKASIDGADAGGVSLLDHATTLLTNQSAAQQADFNSILSATLQLNQQANSAAASGLNLAKDLSATAKTAYADAASQSAGNKNLVMAGMVVIGIAAVSFLGKN